MKDTLKSHGLLLRIFISLALLFLIFSFIQFNVQMKSSLTELDTNMKTQQLNISERLNTIDRLYSALERDLDRQMEVVLIEMSNRYKETGNIDFDLEEIRKEFQDFDLYIINDRNTIVRTTDEVDLNLDFGMEGVFQDFLKEIRSTNSYVSDRVNLSVLTSDIKKYGYYGSHDGQYVFETGYSMKNLVDKLGSDSLDNLVTKATEMSPHILGIRVFNSYGKAYNDSVVLDQANYPIRFEAYEESKERVKTIKVVKQVNSFINETYVYLPFIPEGKYVDTPTLILEFTYTDQFVKEAVAAQLFQQLTLMLFIILIIMGSYILYKKRVLNPLKEIVEGLDDFDEIHINSDPKDEFQYIGDTLKEIMRALRRSINTIEIQNRTLEQAVYDKTSELSEKNEELSRTIQSLKEAQSKLIAKERIQSINKVMIEMNHRLNTPLGNCISSASYTEHLLNNSLGKIEAPLLEDLNEAVDAMIINLNKSRDIIEALNVVSKVNADNPSEVINLKECLIECISDFRAQRKGIYPVSLKCDERIHLLTEPTLFKNAIYYLTHFSTIHSTLKEGVEIDVSETSKAIRVEYISEKENETFLLSDATEPFYLDSFRPGISGLELYLANRIFIDALKGTIQIEKSKRQDVYNIVVEIPKELEN